MAVAVTNELLEQPLMEAKVIADSYHAGQRVTTFQVTFHRFVLAEFNTHRVCSRNSASSRAIPVEKQMLEFADFPAYPLTLPVEKKGMQGGAELEGEDRLRATIFLQDLHGAVLTRIRQYMESNDKDHRLHKSVLNRYMEPWLWHRVIVTATDWDGFFSQRVSELAQPEIHHPADLMQQVYEASVPVILDKDEWHLPYVQPEELQVFDLLDLVKLSTARCARVSYLTHDGLYDPERDVELWGKLTKADPPHASPLEHPCRADYDNIRTAEWNMLDGTHKSIQLPNVGNLTGFMQARHLVLGF